MARSCAIFGESGHQQLRHVTRGNVLDNLGFTPEQATALKFKAELYQTILKYAWKYSQKASAARERIAERKDRE